MAETDQRLMILEYPRSPAGMKTFWLRIAKRGNSYELSASTDGESFQSHGLYTWGERAVKRIGLFANNGVESHNAPEMAATFDCFEVRTLTE